MKKLCMLCAAFIAATVFFHSAPTETSAADNKFRKSSQPVSNHYIVVLAENLNLSETQIPDAVKSLNEKFPGSIGETFTSALKGYAVEMSEKEAELLSQDPSVKYVEEESWISPQSAQADATWGLSRIDQPNYQYPLDTVYNYNSTGAGVSVYVVDTGVLTTHPDFGGRAVDAFDAYRDNTPISQCDGHGTHVAGTIGSTTYGVAKNATVYSVKVFPCWGAGTTSDLLSGIDWINRHANHPGVVNMSLAGPYASTIEDAVQNSINTGLTYVVAAGNYNNDACSYSPAHLAAAITVGSTDQRDYRDSISNFGPCVDIFAPGVIITSTWNQVGSPTFVMSGTSTAAPHVAGVAALYLEQNPGASPAEVQDAIKSVATAGVVTDVGAGSPNLFLYSLIGGSVPTGCGGTTYQGILASPGAVDYQSSVNGFSGGPGKYSANLHLPNGASFSVVLEKKSAKNRWASVASSGPDQSVNYNGKSGTYRWRINDDLGSGSYSLCAVTP